MKTIQQNRTELTTDMKADQQKKKTWWRRLLGRLLGTAMVVAALGLIALAFAGMVDTAGNIPTNSNHAPPQSVQGPADRTLYLTIPKLGLENIKVYDSLSEEKLAE